MSLGGFVTEVLARTRPDLVRAAVLVASAGPLTAFTRLMVQAEHDIAAAGSFPSSFALLEDIRVALPPTVLRDDDAQVEQWAQMLALIHGRVHKEGMGSTQRRGAGCRTRVACHGLATSRSRPWWSPSNTTCSSHPVVDN